MSTVIEQIEQQIAQLSSKAVKKNTGTIRSVADGVAKVDGLSDVMYNEMVQFPGNAIGIALNLEEDEVGCVVLGDVSGLREGDEVFTTGKLLSVPVGEAMVKVGTMGAVPTPLRAAVWGELAALSATDSVAVKLEAEAGVKVT